MIGLHFDGTEKLHWKHTYNKEKKKPREKQENDKLAKELFNLLPGGNCTGCVPVYLIEQFQSVSKIIIFQGIYFIFRRCKIHTEPMCSTPTR